MKRMVSGTVMVSRVIVLLLVCTSAAYGQGLTSGSNGSDGALTLTTPGQVVFDPLAMNLDPDRDNVFHFTTITIGPGVILRLPFNALQGNAVVWLATGAVQIDGTIDLNGEPGHASDQIARAAVPGPGGYPGGLGFRGAGFTTTLQLGLGPGAGSSTIFIGGNNRLGIGAGHAISSAVGGAPSYGNALLVPLRGGSGGSGGGGTLTGGGGGAGGGAIRIFSSTSIVVNGTITANGGNGGSSTTAGNGGGGGSGGGIHLIAPSISGSGQILARGGVQSADSRGNASYGRIRLDAATHGFTGLSDPTRSLGTPYNVPLPAAVPVVRVTSIAGVPVPAGTTGDVATPDVSFSQSGPVAVTIEARNVPVGTVVQVRLVSEAVPDVVVNSTPLAGTLQLSNATADVTFPPGFSVGFVRATWGP